MVVGDAPATLSEFAARLSDWFRETYPAAPAVSISLIEATIRDTWHRRHGEIGSELWHLGRQAPVRRWLIDRLAVLALRAAIGGATANLGHLQGDRQRGQ